MNQDTAKNALISIYDMQGAVRFRDKITRAEYEFDTRRLPFGVYLISVKVNNKYWSHKLIIER